MSDQHPSILLAKLGLDWHNWGLRVLASKLMQAGMEVLYLENVTPEEIVETAIQEDVDVIGLSSHTGAYRVLAPRVMELLKERGVDDVTVVLGGVVQTDDIPDLKEAGIAEVFGVRSDTQEIIGFLKATVQPKKTERQVGSSAAAGTGSG